MTRLKSYGLGSSRRYAFDLVTGMDWICTHEAFARICISEVYPYH